MSPEPAATAVLIAPVPLIVPPTAGGTDLKTASGGRLAPGDGARSRNVL